MTKLDVFGCTRRSRRDAQLNVPIETIIITATNAAIGMILTYAPKTTMRRRDTRGKGREAAASSRFYVDDGLPDHCATCHSAEESGDDVGRALPDTRIFENTVDDAFLINGLTHLSIGGSSPIHLFRKVPAFTDIETTEVFTSLLRDGAEDMKKSLGDDKSNADAFIRELHREIRGSFLTIAKFADRYRAHYSAEGPMPVVVNSRHRTEL